MERGRFVRYGALSGIVAVIIIVVGFTIFASDIPNSDDAAQKWQTFFLDHQDRVQTGMTLISIGLWFAYEVPGTANNGQTLGKRLLGIKVARLDAHAITFWQSIRRWFIVALPAIIGACGWPLAIIDYLWCTWDRPAQQCLHDKAVQTVVVLAPAKPLVPGTERKDDINAGHD